MKNQQLKRLMFLATQTLNKVRKYEFNVLERGPFNARRQTATNNEEVNHLNRRNTSGTLNRQESQSQLTDFDVQDSREVEL